MHISEAQLIAFHFTCPLHSSLLRVIDNDTMTEIPRVFQHTVPQVYHPNTRGYTFQAEAWIHGQPTAGGDGETDDRKWKLRIVTSSRDRPPSIEESSSSEDTFQKKEIMDYCLPDREEIIFRFTKQHWLISLLLTYGSFC